MNTVRRRLRFTVRIDKRYSFFAMYRWARSCGFTRAKAIEYALSDEDNCWPARRHP